MSVQFGKCNFDGKPVDPQELDRARPLLTPYGPDAEGVFCRDNVGIIHRAFHTTKESMLENQPYVAPSGAVMTWDGRLDNREELSQKLDSEVSRESTDLEIVSAAYEAWENEAFARLVGDWALSIWNPRDRILILAKDFVGTRHLYYSVEKNQVTWCSILDPLILLVDHRFPLEEEYIAGWLAFFPAVHLTPYAGIHSVPPSSFVRLTGEKRTVREYWDFDPAKRIRYRTDVEYEEHFRAMFSQAIRRRLRSASPVLAELSGGMDSSSITCMADVILANGNAETPRLDTVSYYDDSEPNWNERPYFTKVEQKRGRAGCHIDVSAGNAFAFEYDNDYFAPLPNSHNRSSDGTRQFINYFVSQRHRALLCGIGGDEVLGGVPTPTPELADLLVTLQLRTLAQKIITWALARRIPMLHLIAETGRPFLPERLCGPLENKRQPDWLQRAFRNRQRSALRGYETRLRFLGALPSLQENLRALNGLRRQLSTLSLSPKSLCERRFPYLDRDLLEFLYAIPREQLVRPRQRRSLMRRALVGIVPDEVLNRKRKAFVARGPMAAVSSAWSTLARLTQDMVSSSLGIIDAKLFVQALEKARSGLDIPIVPILRTAEIEFWLRHQIHLRVLDGGLPLSSKASLSSSTTDLLRTSSPRTHIFLTRK
jgi:asparagine synthase (glutamine-hydrolysing)